MVNVFFFVYVVIFCNIGVNFILIFSYRGKCKFRIRLFKFGIFWFGLVNNSRSWVFCSDFIYYIDMVFFYMFNVRKR